MTGICTILWIYKGFRARGHSSVFATACGSGMSNVKLDIWRNHTLSRTPEAMREGITKILEIQ